MNITILTGNLTKDPEQRTVGDKSLVTFSMACNAGYGDNKKVFFPRVSVWGGRGNSIMRFCHKGSKVTVNGEIYPNEYDGRDGAKHFSLELRANEVDINFDGRGNEAAPAKAPSEAKTFTEVDDDELPF